jgi:hydrogenase maturation protease
VKILGLGNVLMGDDALGPWVIEELVAGWEFPEGVEVLDVGTPGLDLTPYLAEADWILLVDTVRSDEPPGTIRSYSRDQLLSRPPRPRTSPHDPALTEALFALELAGCAPRNVVLVGVVPAEVSSGVGLSPAVRTAVGAAAEEIIDRLSALGVPPLRRIDAQSPLPWWEKEIVNCPL